MNNLPNDIWFFNIFPFLEYKEVCNLYDVSYQLRNMAVEYINIKSEPFIRDYLNKCEIERKAKEEQKTISSEYNELLDNYFEIKKNNKYLNNQIKLIYKKYVPSKERLKGCYTTSSVITELKKRLI